METQIKDYSSVTYACLVISHDNKISDADLVSDNNKKLDKSDSIILVAEDVEANYILINAILGKRYRVVRAINGFEAIELFNSLHPDLILMDIKMPELDGIEATSIIRKISTTTPIVALTTFAYDANKEAAINAGCSDYLSKPITSKQLIAIVKKYIN